MARKVWIISGPAGVGKSTTARRLAQDMKKSAYVSGDDISHMAVSGRERPWESEQANDLVWKNIVALTENFVEAGYDVVVDWVSFWQDVKRYTAHWIEQGIEVRYVILWADQDVQSNVINAGRARRRWGSGSSYCEMSFEARVHQNATT
ncbi:AAA family ATPase [Exiguobacterium mexicanum]|uniref:AAA family ATPase n=1 Tax=Exiguobacterium mexicanum TaxID=340146 RepID=UPI0037C09101